MATIACQAHGNLVNISSRAVADTGDDAVIAGFVIAGDSPNETLIRAAGPALAAFDVTGVLAAAKLELFRDGTSLASNSGWDTGTDAGMVAEAVELVGAFAFEAGSLDAALLVTLSPGAYTALVTPANADVAVGVALVEVYDVDLEDGTHLVNLSTRAAVGTGGDILIAGFVVRGSLNRVLIRGVGPGLEEFGLDGTLSDPAIEVFVGEAMRAGAQEWGRSPDVFEIASRTIAVGGFPLGMDSQDTAVLLRIKDGNYSAQVRGADGGTGVALVELYDVYAVASLPPAEAFDLVGFARLNAFGQDGVTGGGDQGEDYDPIMKTGNYWRIEDETLAMPDFANHFRTALISDDPLIVEINTTIDLSVVGFPDTTENRTAIAHPDLFLPEQESGVVGVIELGSNKTIYSATGAGVIRRGAIAIVGAHNVMIRNLNFRELWEWDDATSGGYDRNDWDYLTLISDTDGETVRARTHHIWIDHCDFANAYDGQVDTVRGSDLMTISWCRFGAGYSDDAAAWVERQMEYLEANASQFPFYEFVRDNFGRDEVLAAARVQRKANLVGNGTSAEIAALDTGRLNITYHHNWYHGADDRMPRMRFGNAHVFNLWADDSPMQGVFGLTRTGIHATSNAAIRVQNSYFVDVNAPIRNHLFPEPDGMVSVEGSINFDRASQTDQGFDGGMLTPPSEFRWNPIPADTGIDGWPEADNANLPSGYFPAGRTADDYIHPAEYLRDNLQEAGVIVPRDEADSAILRRWLQTATPSALP